MKVAQLPAHHGRKSLYAGPGVREDAYAPALASATVKPHCVSCGFHVEKNVFVAQLLSPLFSPHVPQMPVYYYPSGQYPTSTTQQYRPLASVQYTAQRSQQIAQTAQQAGT